LASSVHERGTSGVLRRQEVANWGETVGAVTKKKGSSALEKGLFFPKQQKAMPPERIKKKKRKSDSLLKGGKFYSLC